MFFKQEEDEKQAQEKQVVLGYIGEEVSLVEVSSGHWEEDSDCFTTKIGGNPVSRFDLAFSPLICFF